MVRKMMSIAVLASTVFALTASAFSSGSAKVIHVFVALCDNENQGIVPVAPKLGNGEDPDNNLYWGALYGVRTVFKKNPDWKLLSAKPKPKDAVLERCVFKHKTENVFLVADAYKGIEIKRAIADFLESASGRDREKISDPTVGGRADLVVYVGHNGLMDFRLSNYPNKRDDARRQAVVLACISKSYFDEPLRRAGAEPILWTTGLMAPEAYILEDAIDGWIKNESPESIRTRAARAYDKYQKCGLGNAKRLFAAGR